MSGVVKADFKKKLGAAQTACEGRISPEGGKRFRRVLSVACETEITSCELLAGEAHVTGRALFKILFEDTDGLLNGAEREGTFADKIKGAEITPGVKVEAVCSVVDIETASASAAELKLICVAEITLYGVKTETVEGIGEADGGVLCNREKVIYRSQTASADETVSLSEEKGVKENAARVLTATGEAVLGEADASDGGVRFRGRVCVNVLCETEDGKLFCAPVSFDFSHEMSAAGARTGDSVHASAALKGVTARIEKDEGGVCVLKVEARLSLRAETYAAEEGEITTDAFSPEREITVDGAEFNFYRYLFNKNFEEKLEGGAPLASGMPYADGVLAVCSPRVNVANAIAEAGAVRLEGIASADVIYWNSEHQTRNGVRVELPFSVTLPCDGVDPDCSVMASGVVTDMEARPRKGVETDMSARVHFSVHVYGRASGYCVKSIELGNERPASPAALAVYVVGAGETLWGVSKALRASPEQIMLFNPSLKIPFSGNERVLVYRQKR